MAKQTGLGDNLYVAGYDLSGDIGSLANAGGGPATLDVTSIDKSAFQRIGGLRSGALGFTSFFNPASNQEHARLKTLPTADVILTYARGTTLGNPAACMVAKQLNYDGNREDSGAFTFEVEAQSNGFGLEWGRLLTAGKRIDTGATNGTGVDFAAGTNFSMQGYLQVFAFTGTDVTIKVQHSNDNAVGDPYADVSGSQWGAITTGPQALRSTQFASTLKRWLRVTTSTSAGFTSVTFAVIAVVNTTAVVF